MTQAIPGYPPQAYPPAPNQFPQPGYPPQYPQPTQFPGYPPQQFAPPQVPQQPLAQGTLDDFYNQPSTGGGKSLSFDQKPYGTTYVGIVSRPMGNGDVQQQTNKQGIGQTFKDGRAKLVMLVPLQMEPTPEFPDGRATWYVKGGTRDELARAMAEVGAPEGAPEAGAIIRVTYTGERASGAGYSPTKLFAIAYRRPDGAAPVAPPAAPAAQVGLVANGVNQPDPVAAMAYQAQQLAAAQALAAQQPAAPVAQAPAPAVPQAPAQPAAAPVAPPEMSEAQKELLAKLAPAAG